jgi:hypothetical protein
MEMEDNTTKTEENVTASEEKPSEEKKQQPFINHNTFALAFVIITVVYITLVFKYFNPTTGPEYGTALRISASSMQSTALWFISALGFVITLNGLKFDVYKEIVDEHNIALALLVGFAWLALALVIAL